MVRHWRPLSLGVLVGLALPVLSPASAPARAPIRTGESPRAQVTGSKDRVHHRTSRRSRSLRRAQFAPVPKSFFGLTSEDALATGTATPQSFVAIADLGAGVVREPIRWRRVETAPGRYDFSFYDAFVEGAARAGLQVLPLLFEPPNFRSSAPANDARPGTYPPADERDFADFAGLLVRRYGPGGTFWSEHPDVPPVPIRSWQIWNEPNLPVNWPSGPNPREYAGMLRTVGAGIRAVDPRAEIVTAGLPLSAHGMRPNRFLADMYRAGARGTFDTLGVHPYSMSTGGSLALLKALRRVMNRFGDRRTRMWATELGWATAGPASRFTVSPARQADLIRASLLRLARDRATLRLRGVIYYSWQDAPRWGDAPDSWDHHLGLRTLDGSPKPGLRAFRSTVDSLTRVGASQASKRSRSQPSREKTAKK